MDAVASFFTEAIYAVTAEEGGTVDPKDSLAALPAYLSHALSRILHSQTCYNLRWHFLEGTV